MIDVKIDDPLLSSCIRNVTVRESIAETGGQSSCIQCRTVPLMVVFSDVLYMYNVNIISRVYPKRVKHLLKPTLYNSASFIKTTGGSKETHRKFVTFDFLVKMFHNNNIPGTVIHIKVPTQIVP